MQKKLLVTTLLVFSHITCFGISSRDEASLYRAIDANDIETFDFVRQKQGAGEYVQASKNEMLMRAILRTTSPEILQRILENQPDANVLVRGVTPLASAIQMDKLAFVNILLRAGADANRSTLDGELPLHMLLRKGSTTISSFIKFRDIVALFLAKGVDLNAKETKQSQNNKTVLQLTIEHFKHPQHIKFLLLIGADPSVKDSE